MIKKQVNVIYNPENPLIWFIVPGLIQKGSNRR